MVVDEGVAATGDYGWRRPTLKDVATAAGVSVSTVSRVLNGKGHVSDETRAKVLKMAGEQGLEEGPRVRAPREERTQLLGVITREIADPFYSRVLDHIVRAAGGYGYSVLIGAASSTAIEARTLETLLEKHRCDALIMLGDVENNEAVVSMRSNTPIVGICQGDRMTGRGVPVVNTDNHKGAMLALRHLYDLGHRWIAFIDKKPWMGDIRQRREAYVEFMDSHNLKILPGYHCHASSDHAEAGKKAMLDLMRLPAPPTAVFASSDALAIGALGAVTERKKAVPDWISVIGFDDLDWAAVSTPPLTTIRQPIEEMADKAVELAIHGIWRLAERQTVERTLENMQYLEKGTVLRALTQADIEYGELHELKAQLMRKNSSCGEPRKTSLPKH